MADKDEEPRSTESSDDAPDIAGIEADLKSYWAERDNLILEMRALRHMETEPEVPAEFEAEIVRTPIAWTLIERVAGMLTTNAPQISIPPASEGPAEMERASRLERWTNVALDQLRKQTKSNTLNLHIQSLVADGHSCMKLVHAPQLWAGYPRKKRGQDDAEYNKATEDWKKGKPLPILWTWCDPLTIYPQWDELGLFQVLETDRRSVLSLDPRRFNRADQYPELWQFDRLKRGSDLRSFQQLWRRNSLTYAIDGYVVHHQTFKSPRPCPYVYGLGLEVSTTDPGKRGVSLLYPLRYLLPYLDRLLSQKGTAVRLFCWPTWVLKQSALQPLVDPESQKPMQREIDVRPGGIIPLYSDEELTVLQVADSGPSLDEQIAVIMQMIERASLPSAMYGEGTAGDSGYLINQLIAAGRMKLRPIIEQAEVNLEEIIGLMYDVVETVGQTLHVFSSAHGNRGWVSISPDLLQGYRYVEAKLVPLMPTDTYAVSSKAINEVRAGLRSVQSGMGEIGIEQPDEELRQIRLEKLMAHPTIEGILIQEAAKQLGFRLQPQPLGGQEFAAVMADPTIPPALKQQLLGGAPRSGTAEAAGASTPGQAPPPGPPTSPQAVPPEVIQAVRQALQQMPLEQVAAWLLQQGATADEAVAALVAAGVPPDQAQMAVMVAAGGAGAAQSVGAAGRIGTQPGPGENAVMAAPGVQAAPGAPVPQAGAGMVGPQQRPSGVATGRAPGRKMRSIEG